MEHFEETLSSQMVYGGKILNVWRDQVRLEDGRTALREVVEHHGGVAVLALDTDGCIFMVRQYRYPSKQVLWELPAGKLELGEDPADCGRRELEEECGRVAGTYGFLGKLIPTCAYDTELIHLYYAMDLSPAKQHLDPGEFLTVEKVPLEKAIEMILDGEILDAKTQVGILRFQAMRSKGRV